MPPFSTPKCGWERADLLGVLTYLRAQERPHLLLKFLAQEGLARDIRTQEPRKSSGQDTSSFYLHPRADSVPQLSIPKFHLERTCLPGVLTHRFTGWIRTQFPTTVSPEYLNTVEKQDSNLKTMSHDDDRGL